MVERDFPLIMKPDDNELYCFDDSDLMRRIISKKMTGYMRDELSLNQLYDLYDEFGTLSSVAAQWIIPSMLREILKNMDAAEFLYEALVGYFENPSFDNKRSAYCFTWVTEEQSETLVKFFEYISEETDQPVSLAQENAEKFGKM
ncbi:MAG: hypothetical protein OQK04_01765 [Kangiellaceae bacterium]|nr:hypothetical protein [Kangiellaceae bacterium]